MSSVQTNVDMVVIGSGAAGLAAALTAAQGGAKVVVFEKQRSLGGTSNFFEGVFAVESEMQRERYITYNRDQAFKSIMDYSHWRANPRLVRAIVDESGPTISWLQEQGVEFSDATINMPDSPRTYHVVNGKGEAVIKTLAVRAREKSVDIKLSAPVKRLIKQGEKITGVLAEVDGEDIPVKAGAVAIACGGFANNKEWIKKYSGFDLDVNAIPIGNVEKMGDGIRMAFEAGAGEEGLGPLELYRVGPLGPEFAPAGQIEFASTQPDLWVDARGERYCDETVSFFDSAVGNSNARSKAGYTFSIFDDSIIQHLIENGIDKNCKVDNPPGSRPLDLYKEIKAVLERGSTEVMAADTIEGLAQKMNVLPSTLKTTVEVYNSFCEKHHDDLFAKDPKYLRPIKGPQFYAVRARTVFLGTLGGIKINERAQVVDKKESVIAGLYAAGFDAGGMYGDSYCIQGSSGLASAFALNSGRLAGKNALKFLGK
jgi:fumarate reductase flavoprotein subunit